MVRRGFTEVIVYLVDFIFIGASLETTNSVQTHLRHASTAPCGPGVYHKRTQACATDSALNFLVPSPGHKFVFTYGKPQVHKEL